jgi:hypothetical protein
MARQQTKVVSKAKSASAGEPAPRPVVAREPDSSSIASLAYQLWHQRGCPDGSPETDWFQAEQELFSQAVNLKSPSTKRLLPTRQVCA